MESWWIQQLTKFFHQCPVFSSLTYLLFSSLLYLFFSSISSWILLLPRCTSDSISTGHQKCCDLRSRIGVVDRVMLAGLWFRFRSLDSRSSSTEAEAFDSVISSPVVRRDSMDREKVSSFCLDSVEAKLNFREAHKRAQTKRLELIFGQRVEIVLTSLFLDSSTSHHFYEWNCASRSRWRTLFNFSLQNFCHVFGWPTIDRKEKRVK